MNQGAIADLAGCILWFATLGLVPCMHYFDPPVPGVANPHTKAKPPAPKPKRQPPPVTRTAADESTPVPLPRPRPTIPDEKVDRQGLILPPIEYDHPFDGEVRVVRREQEYPNFAFCKMSHANPIGCTKWKPKNGVCLIYIATDDILARYDMRYNDVLRHEVGHCNGWANHEGARPAGSPRGTPPKQATVSTP
jgi:hypothetical protein